MEQWTDLESAAAALGVTATPLCARRKLVSTAPVLGAAAEATTVEWKLQTSAMTTAAFESAELVAGWLPRAGGRLIARAMHNDSADFLARLGELKPRAGPRLAGTAFLMGGHRDNFWHFLHNAVLRLAALELWPDAEASRSAMIVVPEDLKPEFRPVLSALGYAAERLAPVPTGAAARFERLIVSELPFHRPPGRPVISPEAVQWLRARLQTPPAPGGRRIYLSRADARWRRVTNEPELVEALTRDGFETLRLSELEVPELIRTMQEAAVVVGASGANLGATLFCPPGARVVELTPDTHLNNHYFQTASTAAGHAHVKVLGRASPEEGPDHRRDFAVDPGLVRRAAHAP